MATKTIPVIHTAGATLWFAVYNAAGQVWDFTAGTFKALASAANFSTALTADGTVTTNYTATLDLSTLNAGGVATTYNLVVYDQVGGSPALSDTPLAELSITVQFGVEQDLTVEPNFAGTIDGADIELIAWLEINGVVVDLDTLDAAATCDINLREQSAGSDFVDVDDNDDAGYALSATVANQYQMLVTGVIVSGVDDSNVTATVKIVENGNTWTKDFPCSIPGGS
jgi:hypothetical protein